MRFLLIFLLTGALAGPARAGIAILQSEGQRLGYPGFRPTNEPLPLPGGALADLTEDLARIAPEKVQCLQRVLARTLAGKAKTGTAEKTEDVPIWLANAGVRSHYQVLMSKSPCLATLTEKYYRRLREGEAKTPPAGGDRLPKSGRAALNAVVGQGSFADHRPGFALDEALALSGGRRSLAMAMVGYCGHDDEQNSVPFVVEFSNEKSRKALLRHLDSLTAKNGETPGRGLKADYERMKSMIDSGGRGEMFVKCPARHSSFYAAGSLGAEVDIPAEKKAAIARVQAPNKGAGSLPGKSYHTQFAATMGCRLAGCGLSEERTKQVLQLIASRYRLKRLTDAEKKYDGIRRLIEDRFDLNWDDTQALDRSGKEISAWIGSEAGEKAIRQAGGDEFLSGNNAKISWENWRRNIDAAMLGRGGTPGKTFIYEPMSTGRDPYWDPAAPHKPPKSFCPGWSEERCNEARAKYDTYRTDMDWTEAQQAAGGGFGARFCAKDPVGDDAELEGQACAALDRLNKSEVGDAGAGSSGHK